MRAKKRFRKQMLALLLSAVMIAEPATSAAVTYAAEPVIGQTVDTVEDGSEMEDQDTVETEVGEDETDSGKTDGEEGGTEETGGDESGSDEIGDGEGGSDETGSGESGSDETGSDENGSEDQETDQDGEDADSEEELPADETEEEEPDEDADEQDTVSDNDLEEEEDKDNWQGTGHKAPKLEMQLTSAMVSEKRELKGTAKRLQVLEKNVHYMANEAVFLADSQKYAETVAQGYGATLESCEEGVAVMTFPDEVTEIIAMAEDEKVKLPAVYPNFYYTTCDDISDDIVVYADEVPTEDDNVAMAVPNDPYLTSNYQYHHTEIRSYAAWEYNNAAGKGVKVAVIDSGIQKDHQDLKGRVASASTTCNAPYNGAGDNNNHGTHVSGIIAANANNHIGGAGVAYNASIVSIKALENNPLTGGASGNTADLIKALNAAIKSGARVINMSLGGRGYDPLYEATINTAVNKGIVVVAAAGNDTEQLSKDKNSKNYYSPACFDNVITVSAKTKGSAAKADFSNYGEGIVDITAPGTEIWSSIPTNDYKGVKGTSQAAPMVAATAAYILSVSPDLKNNKTKSTVDTVKKILQNSATKQGYSTNSAHFGAGLLNVEAAIKMAAPSSTNGGTGELTAPEVKIGTGVVANNATIQDTDTITLSATVGGKTDSEVKIYYTTDGKAPSEKSTEYKNTGFTIPASGTKTIKAIAIYYGKKSKVTSVKVKVNAKMKSFVIASKTDSLVLGAGKSMNLITKDITPSYATNKKVTWQIVDFGTAGENVSITAGGQLKATAKITAKTDIKVQATASDGSNVKSNILTITLLPKVDKLTLAVPTVGKGPYQLDFNTNKTVQMTVKVEPDAANTGISYTTSNDKVATVSPAGLVTAVGNGKATITAKTTDGSNKKVTLSVQVTKMVQSITVKSKTGQYQIAAGKTLDMVADVTSDATNKKVKWSISQGEAATINEKTGKLTAKPSSQVNGVSKVTVKAEAEDGSKKFAEKEITVYPAITGSITLEAGTSCTLGTTAKGDLKTSIELKPYTNTTGNAADFFGRAKGSNSGLDNFNYTSSNTNIATVTDKGTVNVATKTGTAKIKVTAKDGSGKSATFTVKVVNPVTSINIYSKTGGNIVGRNKTLALGASVNSNASNKKLTWTSSDPKVATVDKNGKVKGISKSVASVTITATANDGSKADKSFTIKVRPVVTKIAFMAENSLTHVVSYATNVVTKWDVGTVTWLSPYVFDETSPYTPINLGDEYWNVVDFTCSNSNVIQTVPNADGYLRFVAVNPGKATITYKALDGSGKVCKLNVTVVK